MSHKEILQCDYTDISDIYRYRIGCENCKIVCEIGVILAV